MAKGTVRQRRVFYVSGFDPLGPRRYRELYRVEGPLQGAISGYAVAVTGLPHGDGLPFRWRVGWSDTTVAAEAPVETIVEFLGWDDIVRRAVRPSLTYVYGLMFRTLATYVTSGAVRAMLRLNRGPLIAGLTPAAVMMFYLLYAALAGLAAGLLAAGPLGAPVWVVPIAGLAVALLALLATRFLEEQMMVYFMVNDLGYAAGQGGRYPAPLAARLDQFAARIDAALAEPGVDEVLVVGHSSGAQLAVTALARARRMGGRGPAIGLLTLGQSIAMTSFLPGAAELRADLAQLADDRGVFWLDVTTPADGACFALSDPAATCRAQGRAAGTPNPLVISAAFHETMDPAELKRLRWRLLRLHFQYLCHFARPRSFDYFLITAGPMTLARRYQGRRSSPQMMARPVAPVLHDG